MPSYITTISLLQLPICQRAYVDTHRHVAHKLDTHTYTHE